jgi:hypothetical protein
MNKLEKIAIKYATEEFNENNYGIGGGLSSGKFASNRHEDAKEDGGKLTLGEATKLFKTATGCQLEYVKEVIKYAVPNMEWHHAGKLPKAYGGGMKKTYFLNAAEICGIATNWQSLCEKYEISVQVAKNAADIKKELETKKLEFLEANATKKVRIEKRPQFFYETNCEMAGKYGWFCSYGKSYNMTEFYTGWEFETEKLYQEFLKLK